MTKGFTLAEVLIALAIVGVLAAISIPALITKINNQDYVIQLQKANTTLSNAIKSLAQDKGGNLDGAWNAAYNWGWCDYFFKETLAPYLKVSKECKNVSDKGCWSTATTPLGGGTTKDWNSAYGGVASMNSSMELADGMLLSYGTSVYPGDWNPIICNGTILNTNDSCGIIRVDVNGYKGPNIWGRDIFEFIVRKDGAVIPNGAPNTTQANDCKTTGGSFGHSCASQIIKDGWQMNY